MAIPSKHTHHLVLDQADWLWGEHVTPDGGTASLWKYSPGAALTEVLPAARRGESDGYEGTVFAIDRTGDILYLRECQIVRLRPGGTPVPWAGKSCGRLSWRNAAIRYGHIHGLLAWGPGRELYFSDSRTIRRVSPDGSVWTLDGGPAELFGEPRQDEVIFERLMGMTVDTEGNIYVADRRDRSVKTLSAQGKTRQIVPVGALWTPTGVAAVGKEIYVLVEPRLATPALGANFLGSPRLLKISPGGKLQTIAVARG